MSLFWFDKNKPYPQIVEDNRKRKHDKKAQTPKVKYRLYLQVGTEEVQANEIGRFKDVKNICAAYTRGEARAFFKAELKRVLGITGRLPEGLVVRKVKGEES